ncbi:MAG TPA: lysophospholipase [Candidatus Dormibacteraeota bacterium]|nr:lysophospholipase [Candidatus Dormibacteraeota bacterium]
MTHVDGRFSGAGGVDLFWQAWTPADPRAVVVIAHGAGEHSGRYEHVARRLVDAGYAVYALDHRGHGRSAGRRAFVDRMDRAIADVRTLVGRAASENPGRSLFLLGHSMGGTISIAFAARHQDELAGLALSGPVAVLEAASPALRVVASVLSTLTPNLGVFGVDPSLVSRDPEVVRAYREDPLVFHGKLPARTVAELAAAVGRFPAEVPQIRLPLLVMHGTKDALAPVAGATMVHERAASTDKTLRLYEGLYHEILNEPERQTVLGDLLSWLDDRSASSPASR